MRDLSPDEMGEVKGEQTVGEESFTMYFHRHIAKSYALVPDQKSLASDK